MDLSAPTCYQAVLSHDRRFDGVFFTCVKSTGIYCRPICPAIVPKQANCTFVSSAAEAEKAGYRPCLRCRPEHAPAHINGVADSLADRLASHIEETLLADETLSEVARRFNVSERHLRRLFVQRFGLEPKAFLTTRRLLFAKQLLQDSSLPITHIAYSVGFGSPGRLTITMKKAYGFTPERLRRETHVHKSAQPLMLRADYRPPFGWTALLQFLQKRATPDEWVDGQTYHRLVDGREIIITNVPDKSYLTVRLPLELSRQAHAILAKTRRLFDLDANPVSIETALAADPLLSRLVAKYPGLRVPGCWDSFETLLRAVIGQQVSVAGATTLMRRVAESIGITAAAISGSTPEAIAALGFPHKRAATIWSLGNAVQSGALQLDESDPQLFYENLIAIPGIGPWTAEYLRMRVLHWPDAFPAGDLGLQKALVPGERQTPRQLEARALTWRPWRSYATMLLWKSLEEQGGK
ncbi:MAG TPA: Ada metal-binding domain-containing protein [Candidatus Saccharimonadales bacterium]|nr:Ada metal-binding domain-containing protein [Candidatus Saccharimonadales bacterium]